MDFEKVLQAVKDELAKLETSARKLANQNIGDILASAKGKLTQVLEHPELNAAAAIHNSEVNADAVRGHDG
jgi:hypothetical protein